MTRLISTIGFVELGDNTMVPATIAAPVTERIIQETVWDGTGGWPAREISLERLLTGAVPHWGRPTVEYLAGADSDEERVDGDLGRIIAMARRVFRPGDPRIGQVEVLALRIVGLLNLPV